VAGAAGEENIVRRLKSVGLAGLLALALAAFAGVSSASATEPFFHSETEPNTWEATSIKNPVLTMDEVFPCAPAPFTAKTTAKVVEGLTTNLKLECTQGGKSIEINMNGCQFRFLSGGTMSIVGCDSGKGISIKGGKYTIYPQSNLGTVQYVNVGLGINREVIAKVDLPKIKFTYKIGTAEYPVEGARLQGEWQLKGTGTSYTGVWVG
jgi:hypothetical protein